VRGTNGGNWSLLGRDEGEGVLRHPEAPRRVPQNYKVGRKFSYPWKFSRHDFVIITSSLSTTRPALSTSPSSAPSPLSYSCMTYNYSGSPNGSQRATCRRHAGVLTSLPLSYSYPCTKKKKPLPTSEQGFCERNPTIVYPLHQNGHLLVLVVVFASAVAEVGAAPRFSLLSPETVTSNFL